MFLTTSLATLQLFAWTELKKKWPHLCHVPFGNVSRWHQVDVMIGSDHPVMCWRKPVETNQMTLLHGWPIWAGCALVLHWWKSFVGTLVHISPVHTKVVKLTSRHHPMTFCMHFGRLNPWRSETPLSKRWQLRRVQQLNESLRPWSAMTDDTRLESPEKKASWSWPVIMK